VLKLIYHSEAFGPIDLEYDTAAIQVGSAEDNDLVLRHPSVCPHHCVLLFQGEKVLCLPPYEASGSPSGEENLADSEFGAGDTLRIGELQFGLAHSAKTVALPEIPEPAPSDLELNADGARESSQRRYFCPQCRTFVREAEVKTVGLVGFAKRNLCPKCSHLLDAVIDSQDQNS
jgi:hypothetical protein